MKKHGAKKPPSSAGAKTSKNQRRQANPGKRRGDWTPESKAYVRDFWGKGQSALEIVEGLAERFPGVAWKVSMVYSMGRTLGVARRNCKVDWNDKTVRERFTLAWKRDDSRREIAQMFGCSSYTIAVVRKRYGLSARPIGGRVPRQSAAHILAALSLLGPTSSRKLRRCVAGGRLHIGQVERTLDYLRKRGDIEQEAGAWRLTPAARLEGKVRGRAGTVRWTPEKIALFKKHWADGKSEREIAEFFQVTLESTRRQRKRLGLLAQSQSPAHTLSEAAQDAV